MLLAKLTYRFQRGSAARDVATLTIGTGIAQAITIAVTPLLTRLYSPSDFGLLAVFLAIVSVGATLVTLRFETSILVPKENTESANLVFISLLLAGGLSVVLAVLSTLLPSALQGKVGLGTLGNWIPIAFLTAAATAAFAVMQGWLNRQRKYTKIACLRVGQSIALASFGILLGIFNVKDGLLIAQIGSAACLSLAALWFGRSAAYQWKKQQLQITAFAHKNAPKYLLPTALLDVVTLQMPVLMIGMWFGADEAGQFSMAWRLLMIPMTLIGGAMGQVFMQRLSNTNENPLVTKKIFRSSWLSLFAIGLAPFALILTNGDFIFKMILGDEWFGAGALAMILAPMAFAMFISSPTSGAFVIFGLQKYSFIFGVAVFIYRPLCIYIAMKSGDLNLGIKMWVFLEVLQIFIYQMIAWKRIGFAK